MCLKRFRVFTLIVVSICVLIIFTLKHLLSLPIDYSDELSLFNPVYMLANYGKMVYPIHGYFNCMVVHPPLHYIVIALFYKITSNIGLARLLAYLPAFTIVFVTLFKVKLPYTWKVAFAASLFTSFYYTQYHYGTRPTLCLSIYWFNGWLLIEAARQNAWKKSYLIAGSLLIGIASVMHYFAVFSGVGLLVYLWALSRNFSGNFLVKRAAALILPATLIIAIYLTFNIFPNLYDVIHAIRGAPGTGNYWDNIKQHHLLFGLPPFAIAFAVLLFFKNSRHLAFAFLPVPLFVFLLVYQKFDYYFPEIFFMFFSVFLLAANLLRSWIPVLVVPYVMWLTLNCLHTNDGIFKNDLVKFPVSEVARGCAKTLIGNNARVGSRMDNWYIAGSADWLNILPDLYWKDSVPEQTIKRYIASVDFLVDAPPMCNNTLNKYRETLPVWYMQGKLKLHSFFIHEINTSTSQLFFVSSDSTPSINGYALSSTGQLEHFIPKPDGESIFCTFTLPSRYITRINTWPNTTKTIAFALPNVKSVNVRQYDADVESFLVMCVSNKKDWKENAEAIPDIKILDWVTGTMNKVSVDMVVSTLHRTDKSIRFYKNFNDWSHNKPYYQP